jgi:ppGpp synthetase/RelA/SpoT-type nucleotidyltranferase
MEKRVMETIESIEQKTMVDLEKCQRHIEKIKSKLKHLLQEIEEEIITGRDNGVVPVYLTKYRIKKPDSTFLKIKRKQQELDDIKDYAGLRVLCLFENDIHDTHLFLLQMFCNNKYGLDEFKIYNWDENLGDVFIKDVRKNFPETPVDRDPKVSGYKSIHYILKILNGSKPIYVEIQLRTLLQDVWGEIDHSLSYKKGSIHPFIKRSFNLFAKDLSKYDEMLMDLKNISKKQHSSETFFNKSYVPKTFFGYESGKIPELEKLKIKIKKYEEYVDSNYQNPDAEKWIDEARRIYEDVRQDVTVPEMENNRNVNYWHKMEDAFLCFFEQKKHNADKKEKQLKAEPIEHALKTYLSLERDYPDSYMLHFRTGEIYFYYKNDIVNALKHFDNCEKIFLQKDPNINKKNKFIIKLRLALIYWLLGDEYIDIVLEQVHAAEKIYNEEDELKNEYIPLVNNLCYYHLEKYIIRYREINMLENNAISDTEKSKIIKEKINSAKECFGKAKEYFNILLETEKKEKVNRNVYDTLAWFCYHEYKKQQAEYTETKLNEKINGIERLKQAKEFCCKLKDATMYTSFTLRSNTLQLEHIQEIMNEWHSCGLDKYKC